MSGPRNKLDVAIVGLGPAGIAASQLLAEKDGDQSLACFDAGPRPEEQQCPVLHDSGCLRREGCHILTGFGGASLLSGGKLSTLPAGSSLVGITGSRKKVERSLTESLEWFQEFLDIEEPSISEKATTNMRREFEDNGFEFDYYDAHLMTGSEKEVVKGYSDMCAELVDSSLAVQFNSLVKSVSAVDRGYVLTVENEDGKNRYLCENVILAVGISGKDLLGNLCQQLGVQAKNSKLEVGVRLEFPASLYPDIDKAHNDLKIHWGNCRTFCVCKNGQLAPYFHDGVSLLDGHVDRTNETGLTNLGIRQRIPPQEKNEKIYNNILRRYVSISNGVPLRQSYSTFVGNAAPTIEDKGRSSMKYWRTGNINQLYPEHIGAKLRTNVEKFAKSTLLGGEGQISVYAPGLYYTGLEFDVKPDFSVSDGLYIVGEGTGQFRGILQAFSSGLLCAEAIAESW